MRSAGLSRTAVKIATGVVALSDAPGLPRGAGDASARILRAAGLLPPWRERFVRSRGFRRTIDAAGRLMAGGRGHLVRRKAFFDAEARRGPSGALVVLGGGLDTLAVRIAGERPGTACFEVDRPDASAAKAGAVAAAGLDRPNLRFVPLDLSAGGVVECLVRAGFGIGTPSVAIAEGLLMYLREAAVAELLASLAGATGPGSRIAFSWMRRSAWGAGLIRLGVRLAGEPIRWATEEAAVARLFWRTGWRPETSAGGIECLATATREGA